MEIIKEFISGIPGAIILLLLIFGLTKIYKSYKHPFCPLCRNNLKTFRKRIIYAVCDNHYVKVGFISFPSLKKIAAYLFLLGIIIFFGITIGCASAPKEKEIIIIREKIYKEDRNDIKLAVWNETDYNIKLSILRSNGKLNIELKKNAPPQIVKLSKGGRYEYYAFAYDEDMRMLSETEGRFEIRPGKTSEHRGIIAGYHLKIKGLRWKDSEYPSVKIFGDNNTWGKIEYGKNKDKLTTNAQIRGEASGIFALILRRLTRTKAGEE